MRLFLLLLILTSCGQEQNVEDDYYIDQGIVALPSTIELEPWSIRLAEYEHQFRIDAEEHGIDLANQSLQILQYADLDGTTIGRCYREARAVYIDPEVTDETILKTIIYHELGHCYLNQSHTSGIMSAGITVDAPEYYVNKWDELLAQLFYEGETWE